MAAADLEEIRADIDDDDIYDGPVDMLDRIHGHDTFETDAGRKHNQNVVLRTDTLDWLMRDESFAVKK